MNTYIYIYTYVLIYHLNYLSISVFSYWIIMKSLLILTIVSVFALDTGILIGFTPDAINNILKDFLPVLSDSIQQMPGVEINIPSIGKGALLFDLKISELIVPVFKLDSEHSGVTFQDNRKITFTLQKITMDASLNWQLSRNNFKQLGKAMIEVTKANLNVVLTVSDKNYGMVTVDSTTFEIEQFSVKFLNSPAASILNWVLDAINVKVKQALGAQIAAVAKGAFQTAFNSLATINKIPLGEFAHFSLVHTNAPVVNRDYIYFSLDGVVKLNVVGYEIDIPKPVPLSFTTSESSQISISSYTLNSGIFAFYISESLRFNLKDLGINLDCNFLESVFPGISAQYGEHTPADISCKAKSCPLLDFSNGKITTKISLECSLNVEGKGTPVTLEVDANALTSVTINNWVINGAINSIIITDVIQIDSKLNENVKVEGIKNLGNLTFKLVQKKLNKLIFGDGIILPTIGKLFIDDLNIEIKEGFVLVEGSPKYPN